MTAAYFEDHPTDPDKVILRKSITPQPEACKECHLKDLAYDLLGELKVANLKLSVRAQQRTWVGLTDEEMDNFVKAAWGQGVTAADFIRAIEAKLKEKNT
jgi:hypothetical protein